MVLSKLDLSFLFMHQEIECPVALIEEEPSMRKEVPVKRVEKMFEQIRTKLSRPPTFILCALPERKNSEIYGME